MRDERRSLRFDWQVLLGIKVVVFEQTWYRYSGTASLVRLSELIMISQITARIAMKMSKGRNMIMIFDDVDENDELRVSCHPTKKKRT